MFSIRTLRSELGIISNYLSRTRRVWAVIVLLVLMEITLVSQPAFPAGVWYVTVGGNDANDCLGSTSPCTSIQGALSKPGFVAGDTIRIAIGTYTGSGNEVVLLDKAAALSGGWDGAFSAQTGDSIIDGGGARRGITVSSGVSASIERFLIRNGVIYGIFNNAGTLTVRDSTISDNNSGIANWTSATLTLTNVTISDNSPSSGIINLGMMTISNAEIKHSTTSAYGGGIKNGGAATATLENVTVSGNRASGDGSFGLGFGGGIWNQGNLNIFNTTISSNSAEDSIGGLGIGGGVYNISFSGLRFDHVTVTNNRASQGAGLVITGASTGTRIKNTIIANNAAGDDCVIWGAVVSLGHNLDSDNTCKLSSSGDLTNIDPLLGPLQDNGGFAFTHALLPGSPAIDAGSADCLPPGTDQRGFGRPVDCDGNGAAICDIGAYEFAAFTANQPVDFVSSSQGLTGPLLAGGGESTGLTRGPAFQLFSAAGVLQTTQFALNVDFSAMSFVLANFDADAANEVLVGGQETAGMTRGPAYQLFDSDGSFKFTRFVLNSDFSNVSFSPFDGGSNGVLGCGREVTGLGRGPAYQTFDASGSLVRTQFALNADFTVDNACLGINLDGIVGDEVIMFGREVTGAARGPALQAFNSNGNLRFTQFVLNPDFSETKFVVANLSSNGIIAYGRETSGAGRGPALQIFDSSGNFILTRFALNRDFTEFQVFGANTTNAVAGEEIVTGGTETRGLARGCVKNAFCGTCCCIRDEGGSFGVGFQEQAPNSRKLLPSNGGGGERYGKRRE